MVHCGGLDIPKVLSGISWLQSALKLGEAFDVINDSPRWNDICQKAIGPKLDLSAIKQSEPSAKLIEYCRARVSLPREWSCSETLLANCGDLIAPGMFRLVGHKDNIGTLSWTDNTVWTSSDCSNLVDFPDCVGVRRVLFFVLPVLPKCVINLCDTITWWRMQVGPTVSLVTDLSLVSTSWRKMKRSGRSLTSLDEFINTVPSRRTPATSSRPPSQCLRFKPPE